MADNQAAWPPEFTLDQESILNLLTGDRFYTNPSAALREAVLNAIDAVQRRRTLDPQLTPQISVLFDSDQSTLSISDNGVGMSRQDIVALFTKVGASAATAELDKQSVGEFGIGVISYFMAGDAFTLQTYDGKTEAIALAFDRRMLAGGAATSIHPELITQGTTVRINVRNTDVFQLLLNSFPHWCRDVEGLVGRLLPANEQLAQGVASRSDNAVGVDLPLWVERAHLTPVADPTGWDAMTGASTIAVLYRGVFVQEFEVKGAWGIQGSIDVDPKHFKPSLNREGFIAGEFQTEVEAFLRSCHPAILTAMAARLAVAFQNGSLDKWTEKRWGNLWLSVPRANQYADAAKAWDAVFRSLPAFELATPTAWEPASIDRLVSLEGDVFVAPLANQQQDALVEAALRYLRNSRRTVIRGIQQDLSWMPFAGRAFGTTADLITAAFADELPRLLPLRQHAERVLSEITPVAPLFTGPPSVDLVRLSDGTAPALRLANRLVINVDHPAGEAIVREALRINTGPVSLIEITARSAYDQLGQVAAVVRDIHAEPEILSPVRRRFIESCLS